jgi:hypothetical protein
MYVLYSIVLGFLNANSYPILDYALDQSNTYFKLVLLCFVLPILYWLVFYKLYSNPYSKLFHYLIALLLSLVLIGFLSYSLVNEALWGSNNQALNDLLASDQPAIEIADALPLYLSIYNVILSAILGFVYSIFLKRFSKIQMHLPF